MRKGHLEVSGVVFVVVAAPPDVEEVALRTEDGQRDPAGRDGVHLDGGEVLLVVQAPADDERRVQLQLVGQHVLGADGRNGRRHGQQQR